MNQMSMFPDHQFHKVDQLEEFMLAGKAKITIRSEKTLKHYTFKVKAEKDKAIWYVSKLTSDNQYIYVGTIFENKEFRTTRKTPRWIMAMEWFKAFEWFWRKVHDEGVMPPNTTVFHEGRCGACGLELTDPVSIKEGYGPECRKKRLRRPAMNDRNAA